MIKSIVLAVVVSLVIWAITFDSWFDFNKFAPSIAVAVAAGLIIALLVRALPGLALQLVLVAVGAGIILFVVSKLFPSQSCPGPKQITISCQPPAATPNHVCIDKGGDIEWITAGVPEGTRVKIHDFKKKVWYGHKKDDPLQSPPPEGTNQSPITGKVRNDKHGEFKYSVTCTPGGTEDPMIEVPKGR